MEHRWCDRAAVPVSVTVYRRGTPLLTTFTRNLSPQGALLHADSDELGSVRSVELGFELDSSKHPEQLRLTAYVIHRRGGIGLMFTDQSASSVRALEGLLRSSRNTKAQA